MKMDKHERYRRLNQYCGLCPCCGDSPAPGRKQCAYRILYKNINRRMNNLCKRGVLVKLPDGRFAISGGPVLGWTFDATDVRQLLDGATAHC
jgi:hypothetical protein